MFKIIGCVLAILLLIAYGAAFFAGMLMSPDAEPMDRFMLLGLSIAHWWAAVAVIKKDY